MPDFYFRGTISQYWRVLHAEYLRLTSLLGQEPFEIVTPSPKTILLADYTPNVYDFIEIQFWEAEHRDVIVSVNADSVLDAELVNLYVNIYVTPLKKYGDSNLHMWQTLKDSLNDQGFLVHPAAKYQVKKQSGMHEETKRKLAELREYRMETIRNTGKAPKKGFAMGLVGVSHATCKAHDPQLLKHWKDPDYE